MSATTSTSAPTFGAKGRRTCDGVICFGGEDWWYHNRGHFDMQMMRELSRSVPTLYVNSIGMRVPKVGEGRMFLHRVLRKVKSWGRGFVRIRPGFAVLSPVSVPGRLGAALSKRALALQVRRAARRMGIRRPLVWVACPPGVNALDGLRPVAVVYQRTDRFEAFANVDRELIAGYDRALKRRADLTIFCSRSLHAEEASQCVASHFTDHGVDYEVFASAGASPTEPAPMKSLPRPRVGFVGGIDIHTFDPPLFLEVAAALPEVCFALVGGCSLPEGWCTLPNVRLIGRVPYDEVAGYMAACDVLIMPWNDSEWIKACNPVKLKEYLAIGRPVVSTAFDELTHYQGFVRTARTSAEFAAAIREALEQPHDPGPGRRRVERETWEAKCEGVLGALEARGIRLAGPDAPAGR